MKITDIVHNYPAGMASVTRGMCRVRAFLGPAGTVVLMTDLGEKCHGPSVTNAVEYIIQSLVEQGHVIQPAIFVEHYEHELPEADTFDIVTISSEGRPHWDSTPRSKILELVGDSQQELDERSSENMRIAEQVDRIRFARNPFIDAPFPESNEIVLRRLQIADGMISKKDIQAIIHRGASEQEIQRLLKTDLSIFGEAYAKPDDEYICFSEFPVADGAVDFVVLTGRSRMDVVFVEVKGANFNLLNNDHYKEFNHKVNQAAGQIRERVAHVFRNLPTFRSHVHAIRARAEAGESVYNAFLGPQKRLEVSGEKDINIRTVVIGGRTVNDREESEKRQNYELGRVPPIRIESWDTWLRRLQRQ